MSALLRVSWLVVLAACSGTIRGGDGESGAGGDEGYPDGNLPDGDEPVTPTGQALVIDTPARGAMIEATPEDVVEVRGRVLDPSAGDGLTIDGEKVTVGSDGAFATEVPARVGGNVIVADLGGARAQRSFLYGSFAAADAFVPSAAGLRINREGFDDGDGEIDDISSLVAAALADRDLIKLLPASYSFNMAVVGTVKVDLTERSAGPPEVDLTPRAGGLTAVVRLPDVRVRHKLTFNCAITTCTPTGTATADAIEVSVELDVSLDGDVLHAASRDARIDVVNFHNDEDGVLASVAQSVVEFFVPDLEGRIEGLLQPAVADAASADTSLALGGLSVPATLDLAPALDATIELTQQLDAASFEDTGALVGLAVRARGGFESGDPGAGAPGWLQLGGDSADDYRVEPPFGASLALDLVNQILFAVWGQGGLARDLPALADLGLGDIRVSALATPVIEPEGDGGGVRILAGDVQVDSTLDGVPITIVCSLLVHAELSVDAGAQRAIITLADEPTLYAELTAGPGGVAGTVFRTLVEELAPAAVAELVGSVALPLPSLPLDPVAAQLAGKEMRIAPPAELVTGEPPARVTLYGRFLAQ
jgi:hypothetical protein